MTVGGKWTVPATSGSGAREGQKMGPVTGGQIWPLWVCPASIKSKSFVRAHGNKSGVCASSRRN